MAENQQAKPCANVDGGRGPFLGPKKLRAPQKVEILCKGPFRILEMAP